MPVLVRGQSGDSSPSTVPVAYLPSPAHHHTSKAPPCCAEQFPFHLASMCTCVYIWTISLSALALPFSTQLALGSLCFFPFMNNGMNLEMDLWHSFTQCVLLAQRWEESKSRYFKSSHLAISQRGWATSILPVKAPSLLIFTTHFQCGTALLTGGLWILLALPR